MYPFPVIALQRLLYVLPCLLLYQYQVVAQAPPPKPAYDHGEMEYSQLRTKGKQYYYNNEPFCGTAIIWAYKDGKKDHWLKKGTYINGLPHGVEIDKQDVYRYQSEKEYDNGELIRYTVWYSDSVKEVEKFYKNGQLNGTLKQWHENGKLAKEEYYRNGKKDGPAMTYHANGQMESTVLYKEDCPTGTWVNYYDNGQKSETCIYVDCQPTQIKRWWSNGEKKEEGDYTNYKMNGPWTLWDGAGRIVAKASFTDWMLNTFETPDPSYQGMVPNIAHYIVTVPNKFSYDIYHLDSPYTGRLVDFYDNGYIRSIIPVTDGKRQMEYQIEYTPQGGLKQGEYKTYSGPGKCDAKDDTKTVKRFIDGVVSRETIYKLYYPDTLHWVKQSETTYHGNTKDRSTKEWWPNGKLQRTYQQKDEDHWTGIWTTYFQNGQKESEGVYDGYQVKVGKWSYWDENGNVVKEEMYDEDGVLK